MSVTLKSPYGLPLVSAPWMLPDGAGKAADARLVVGDVGAELEPALGNELLRLVAVLVCGDEVLLHAATSTAARHTATPNAVSVILTSILWCIAITPDESWC